LPNQDALSVRHRTGSSAIVAVADGHGSRRSFRSEVGSAFAVELAVQEVDGLLDELTTTDAAALSDAGQGLNAHIIDAWRASVAEHLAENPVRDEELEGVAGGREEHDNDPLRAYGATLLLAVVTEEAVLLQQLGDGDIVVRTMAGEVIRPIPRDKALVADETTSLCLDDAERYSHRVVIDRATSSVSLILLATDGYGHAFEDPGWHEGVVNDFAEHARRHGADWIEQRLPTWLADSARVGGDDVTVALALLESQKEEEPLTDPATERAASVTSVPTEEPTEQATVGEPVARPKRRRRARPTRRRCSLVVGGAVAGLLAIGVAVSVPGAPSSTPG